MGESLLGDKSVLPQCGALNRRKVNKVPYVELFGGRLQGVVSSKSDIRRVYVSFIEAGTTNYYCCTNNNRPCGGLRGSCCKHLMSLIEEAVLQFGNEQVVKYLKLKIDPTKVRSSWDISRSFSGTKTKAEAGLVFSRFLNYLRYFELASSKQVMPEMSWFVAG